MLYIYEVTMKTLLITGASGFLGSKILKTYHTRYQILSPSHKEIDITNEVSVNHYFCYHRPDIIIHCAAISDTATCENDPALSYLVNVKGSENIAKAAKLCSAKCIMCSSDQVYCGSQKESANRESDTLSPYNVYGKDKAYAELSCLSLYPETVHLRLAWMYDANSTSMRNDFLKQLKNTILLPKSIFLPANDKRGITDVWEVVNNMEKTFSLPGGIYNFGSPNEKSTYETALFVFENLGYDTSLIQKRVYDNSRNLSMSQEKINQFGISFLSTEDGLIHNLKKFI